jgi:ketosteroid isomerase-like protein
MATPARRRNAQEGDIDDHRKNWNHRVWHSRDDRNSHGSSRDGGNAEDDVQAIQRLIAMYATSIDRADTQLAEQIFSNGPEVSFIHPRGEERGRAAIEANVYRALMGATFSERKLSPTDAAIHVYGDSAWSEFNWDFVAKVRKDGSPFHSRGRETQIYRREGGRWQIVHVHYSGAPVTGELRGFQAAKAWGKFTPAPDRPGVEVRRAHQGPDVCGVSIADADDAEH